MNNKVILVIPMAGAGSRFAQQGYSTPKPMIRIGGMMMFEIAVENTLQSLTQYQREDIILSFVVQHAHCVDFGIDQVIQERYPNSTVTILPSISDGTATSVLTGLHNTLRSRQLHVHDVSLLVANSDQYIDFGPDDLVLRSDGTIAVFDGNQELNWSYAQIDENNNVIQVAEKRVISNHATCGIYWWKSASDYVESYSLMKNSNDKTNNEYYVCPAYNYTINLPPAGRQVKLHYVNQMFDLGSPQSLSANYSTVEQYLKSQELI